MAFESGHDTINIPKAHLNVPQVRNIVALALTIFILKNKLGN